MNVLKAVIVILIGSVLCVRICSMNECDRKSEDKEQEQYIKEWREKHEKHGK